MIAHDSYRQFSGKGVTKTDASGWTALPADRETVRIEGVKRKREEERKQGIVDKDRLAQDMIDSLNVLVCLN